MNEFARDSMKYEVLTITITAEEKRIWVRGKRKMAYLLVLNKIISYRS